MRNVNTASIIRPRVGLLTGFCALALVAASALAFPPAPYHTLYGMVRDEMGNPLMSGSAVVTLTTATGVSISTTIVPNLAPGMNYRLEIPMDAGLTSTAFKPTALRPYVGIRLMVVNGGQTYYPMEVKANFSNLGQPAMSTRMDMTLGVDSDGDGLPDAWEYLMIEMGYGQTLADIRPQDDSDGDGISNYDEYIAGTYAFDPTDGFKLNIVGIQDNKPLLEFMVLPGRCYTVEGSTDMKSWSTVNFRDQANGAGAPPQSSYPAADVRTLRVAVEITAEKTAMFFRARVQ